ncbi:MAG: hypothetical protein JXA99_02645 [Candidatus Lokiarchaeota archaeon]|nr:hypothetical protein [Candidatus Lokiarchaeota archaeon]
MNATFKNKEENLIEILQKTGLSYNEALIYFTLLRSGDKGSIVKELAHTLPLQRTNIYSILHKLIELNCVKESGFAEKSKNATIFIAVDPIDYLNNLIRIKQNDLNKIKDIQDNYSNELHSIFSEGMEFSYDEIDISLQPYLKPLLEKGWKIKSYFERKESLMLYYKVFDCMLFTQRAKILKDCSFHLFIFDYSIEEDENAFLFFLQALKRKTTEMKSYFFDITKFKLFDDSIELLEKKYHIFIMKIRVEDIKNSDYFKNNSKAFWDIEKLKSDDFYEIGKAIILPIKEKIFYLWAESNSILMEMIEPILNLEYEPR